MPIISQFDVSIGTTDTWHSAEIVPVDHSRTRTNDVPRAGKEFRYWRLTVTENGATEEVEGRLLIAGINNLTPETAVVVQPGLHMTWVRVTTSDEVIVVKADVLTML